jgi:hypothetical protein
MRKTLLIAAALLGLLNPSAAQNNAEMATLRGYLKVSDKVPVASTKTPRLPTERPLVLYIDTAGDGGAANEVMQLVQEVNKKQADKFGTIEVSSDAAKANLLLIHYEVDGSRRKATDTTNSMDPALGRGQTRNVLKADVSGYVVARKADGLEILSHYKKEITLGERRQELRDAFSKLLKEQSKLEKH